MFHESFAEAWRQRFGKDPGVEFPSLGPFLTHRSVREYAAKPVTVELMAALVGVAQGAATSSNLQLWSVVSVEDPAKREEMAKLCGDQIQVRTAPWFLAFCADHHRLRHAAQQVGESGSGLDYCEFAIMAIIDATLAAERLVCAAEAIGLGTCYIGAMRNDPDAVASLLGLPEGVFGVFGLCVGWPDELCRAEIKPRLSQKAVWFRDRYDAEPDVQEYNLRMEPFYVSQGMKGAVTWAMRSGRRVDGNHMTGREVLKEFLDKNGFCRR